MDLRVTLRSNHQAFTEPYINTAYDQKLDLWLKSYTNSTFFVASKYLEKTLRGQNTGNSLNVSIKTR